MIFAIEKIIFGRVIMSNDKGGTYTISGNAVKLRPGPGTSYEAGGLLNKGDEVENIAIPSGTNKGKYYVDADGYRWVYVLVLSGDNKGNKGYVASDYVSGY